MLNIQVFTFNPVQENTYLLYNETGACCIIDPGCYFASEEAQLASFIRDNGLKPELLLNTHCHFDHIFGNNFVRKTWGLELYLHELEEPVLERGPATSSLWQLSFVNYEGPKHHLKEGDTLEIGGDTLQVVFLPGHSPGSIGFYNKAAKWIISGDVLFQGGIGRTDLPGGNFDLLKESIQTKLFTLPEDVVVYPGHGGSTTIGDEIHSNPFVKME